MAFFEISFPVKPNEGMLSGPGFNTNIMQMDSGQERRIQRHLQARRRFDLAQQVQSHDDVRLLVEFYMRVAGPANGFRLKDWSDYSTNALGRLWGDNNTETVAHTDVTIGTGAPPKTVFQLVKLYGSTPPIYTRTITKPMSGTVKIGFDGVNQASGWTVDTTTGKVTFSVAPSAGVVVSAGFEFDVPVRFGIELDEMMPATMDDHGSSSVQTVPMVELLDENPIDEFASFGGAIDDSISADISLTQSKGRFHSLEATAAGLKAILPAKADLPFGFPLFIVQNRGAVNTFEIHDVDTSTSLITLALGKSVIFTLGKDPVTNAAKWFLFKE